MRKFLSLVGCTLLLSVTMSVTMKVSAQNDDVHQKEPFIGAWKLAWLEEPDSAGKVHRADCTGLLVYTPDGHMSVQVMYRNTQAGGRGGPVSMLRPATRPRSVPIRSTMLIPLPSTL